MYRMTGSKDVRNVAAAACCYVGRMNSDDVLGGRITLHAEQASELRVHDARAIGVWIAVSSVFNVTRSINRSLHRRHCGAHYGDETPATEAAF